MRGLISKRDLGVRYVRNMVELNTWLTDKWLRFKQAAKERGEEESLAPTEAEMENEFKVFFTS